MQSKILVTVDPASPGLTIARPSCPVSSSNASTLFIGKGRKAFQARCLQPHLYSVTALCRYRTSVTMASISNGHKQNDIQLFVLSGTEAPELQELKNLPEGVKLLGTGRPDKECKSRLNGLHRLCNRHLLMQLGMQAGARRIGAKSRCSSNAEQGRMHRQSRSYRCCTLCFSQYAQEPPTTMRSNRCCLRAFIYQPCSRTASCLHHSVSRFCPV